MDNSKTFLPSAGPWHANGYAVENDEGVRIAWCLGDAAPRDIRICKANVQLLVAALNAYPLAPKAATLSLSEVAEMRVRYIANARFKGHSEVDAHRIADDKVQEAIDRRGVSIPKGLTLYKNNS